MTFIREVFITDEATGSKLDVIDGKISIGSITGTISLPSGAATENTLNSLNDKDFATQTTLGSMLIKQTDKNQWVKITDGTNDVGVTGSGFLQIETTPAPGTTTDISIKDPIDGYFVSVTSSGELKVVNPPPSTPAGTTSINQGEVVYPGKNGGEEDIMYTISTGSTLYLQRFTGGTEATSVTGAGGKIELWYDPDGDMGGNAELINVAYLTTNNFQYDLALSYVGDGTKRIVLRATNWSSSNGKEFAMFFDGYEEVTS